MDSLCDRHWSTGIRMGPRGQASYQVPGLPTSLHQATFVCCQMTSIASSLVFDSPQLSHASRLHVAARMNFLIKHISHNSHHCSKAFNGCPLVSGDRPKPLHPRYIPNAGPGPGMLSLSSSSHLGLTQIWSRLNSSPMRPQLRDLLPKGLEPPPAPGLRVSVYFAHPWILST